MLKEILSITGKPGLFKLVQQGNNMLIVESLIDGKRMPTYARDKIVTLGDITMFTETDDIPLAQVLDSLYKKESGQVASVDVKADNDTLRAFFAEVVPNFDRERVYPSDIRKLINWYNLLIKANITNFIEAEVAEESTEDTKAALKTTKTATTKKAVTPKSSAKPTKAAAPKQRSTTAAKKG